MTRQQETNLQILAANVGIDSRGLSLEQIRHAHNVKRDPQFCDQHDMKLDEFLKRMGA